MRVDSYSGSHYITLCTTRKDTDCVPENGFFVLSICVATYSKARLTNFTAKNVK